MNHFDRAFTDFSQCVLYDESKTIVCIIVDLKVFKVTTFDFEVNFPDMLSQAPLEASRKHKK